MGQIIVRDLPQETLDALASQAGRNRRSLEAEVREILVKGIESRSPSRFDEAADRMLVALAERWKGDAASMIREDRDSR